MSGRRTAPWGVTALVLLAGTVASGCATFFRPSSTTPPTAIVRIESDPQGAEVAIGGEGGEVVGRTPLFVALSRRLATHELHLELDGCAAQEYELHRSTSRWRAVVAVLFGTAAGMGGALEGGAKALPLSLVAVLGTGWWSGALFDLPSSVEVPLQCDARESRPAG